MIYIETKTGFYSLRWWVILMLIILISMFTFLISWHYYDKGYKEGYDKCVKDNFFTIYPKSQTLQLKHRIIKKNTLMQYSTHISKEDIVNHIICLYDTNEQIFNSLFNKIMNYADEKIVREFNKKAEIKIRVFGPGLFQLKYQY